MIGNAIARAAVECARSLTDTKAIVAYTGSGGTARLVSDYRPDVPIYAFTTQEQTFQSLSLYWGVTPVRFTPSDHPEASFFEDLDKAILQRELFERGDRVVVTMGWPLEARTSANLLKIHRVGSGLRSGE